MLANLLFEFAYLIDEALEAPAISAQGNALG
jgi:hypothetical protein